MTPFSPQVLLSKVTRARCVEKLKELPVLVPTDFDPSQTAAVLVPLCIVDGEVSLLYTLRSRLLKKHSGQVSFPGGKTDSDETPAQTALRETHEETGIPAEDIEVWGAMPQVQGRDKNMFITAVIGEVHKFDKSKLKINTQEVDEIFTVPIKNLCNPSTHGRFVHNNFSLPLYLHKEFKVWGITGFLTHQFLTCLLSDDVYNFNFSSKKYSLDELMPSKL